MIDSYFIKQYDNYISCCILKYTSPPIHDYKQDIYLLLCSHTFHNGNIKAYIAKIVRNYFINRFKKNKIEKIDADVATNSSELCFIYKDQLKKLEKYPHFECLELFAHGFRYREIALKLNVSIGTVRSRIYNLRRKLKQRTTQRQREERKLPYDKGKGI